MYYELITNIKSNHNSFYSTFSLCDVILKNVWVKFIFIKFVALTLIIQLICILSDEYNIYI